MFGHRSIFIGLCACLSAPAPAGAAPLSYVTVAGYANAQAADGLRTADQYRAQNTSYGSPDAMSPGAIAGATDAHAIGNVTSLVGSPGFAQGASATASSFAAFGAVHGVATAGTSTALYQYRTIASATSYAEWLDTITFHTSAPGGADFRYSLSLFDALDTTIVPFADPTYHGGLAKANAQTSLAVTPQATGVSTGLTISDSLREDPSFDGVTPGPVTRTPPASRTETGTIHVADGDVVSFQQIFYLTVESENLDAMASAIAGDTAYFDLVSFDEGASYTSASGTVYATAGDPDLPTTGPTPGGTIPEPSNVALMFAGLVAFAYERRRMAR